MKLQVFIGSSSEGRGVMDEVAEWVEYFGHSPRRWTDHDLFPLGETTFRSLHQVSRMVDAALFVFNEDDTQWYREDKSKTPRDNVVLEYGLFAGALGERSVAIAMNGQPKIASDLLGITYLSLSHKNAARNKLGNWLKEVSDATFQRSPSDSAVETHEIRNSDDDFQVMYSYYQKARWIYVCSGDFNWIKENQKIRDIVVALAKEEKFRLESYASAAEVKSSLGDDLFRRICASARFESKRSINCSLIKQHDNRMVFLYRTRVGKSGNKYDQICVLNDRGEFAYMLDPVLKDLLMNPAAEHPLLLVVGLPASGKSTVAKLLEKYGYGVVSAGDYVREVARNAGREVTSKELEETGRQLLKNEGPQLFALELLKRVKEKTSKKVAIEGIRPSEVVGIISRYVENIKILYVDADETERERRIIQRKKNGDGAWRLKSDHERCVQEIRPMATILRNDGGLKKLENQLKEFLVREM